MRTIICFFVFFALWLGVTSPSYALFGGLKEEIQKELDGNPFLNKQGIKLKVTEEQNGYVTIEMYEGNRKVRKMVNRGVDILTNQVEQEWLFSVSENEKKTVNVLRRALMIVKNLEGVKDVLLVSAVNTPRDLAEDDYMKGVEFYNKEKYAEAAELFRKAAALEIVQAQNVLAWIYATSNNESLLDGKEAIKYALLAYNQQPENFSYIDTLAASYARNGQFDLAIKYQEASVKLLKEKGSSEHKQKNLEKANFKLKLYYEGKPYTKHKVESYADGGKYEGEKKEDKRHGQGIYTYADGHKYFGDWVEDKRNGQGKLLYPNGAQYVGGWRDDLLNGQGILTYADGGKYDGEWKGGKRHGQGTLIYGDGAKYAGEWKDDERHGQGTMVYNDGGKYVGEWKDDYLNGQGILTYADGRIYEGGLKDNNWHGKGTFSYSDGGKYTGEWKDGQPTENGTIIYSNGSRYEGEWNNYKPSGQGTLTYTDGAKYIGEWKDGKKNGYGSMTNSDGSRYEGEWKDDKKIRSE